MRKESATTDFDGRIALLGFGSIGQAVLPLLFRHITVKPSQIEIIKPSSKGTESALELGVGFHSARIERGQIQGALGDRLKAGDLLLNLSVDVGSIDLMSFCRDRGLLYIDASTESWPGESTDRSRPLSERTNYAMREHALALRRPDRRDSTALITMGANPGMVSLLVKQALLDLSGTSAPETREGWAEMALQLGLRTIHVSERDSQQVDRPKRKDEFINTWSVQGFVGEGLQPAELGWGTHERHFPEDGARQEKGCKAAIYLKRPGMATRVRSWAPLSGPFHGFLVSHAESISIADHLTLGDREQPRYRPTVHYAYHPCEDAVLSVHELSGRQWKMQKHQTILRDDIVQGRDELGVLLMGRSRGRDWAYWHGSQLSIEQARGLCPFNSATSLQVAAPIVAGMSWIIQHPDLGVIEPDDLPLAPVLAMIRPYLGDVVGVHTDWTPLRDRESLFDEPLDRTDPWQFINFRVT
ncbi:MAG: homospermidine synthase [Burkholderiales bacterium]|nr:homospermidine synthase [Burkholderiales bacterium]